MAQPTSIMFTLPFFLLLLLLFFHCSIQLQLSQYQALLSIQHHLNFPQHLIAISNEDPNDACTSEPTQVLTLACYDDNVTQLHIIGNGSFPRPTPHFSTPALFSHIAALPNLKVLSLVSLGLKGPLPPEIAYLSSLEILNMSLNAFEGSIPVEVSSMRNLETLILDHNCFTGHVPDWLSSLPALRVLSLLNNSFAGPFPNAFSSMATLRTLVLSANNLSGQVPKLHGLTNLQVLDLGNNNLGPKFPSLPKKLVSVVLSENKFHSALVLSDELSSCYQLQKLDISSNQLLGMFSPSILLLPSLIYLDISGNKFTGRLSRNMSTCNAQLKFVNLSDNRFTGELPDCLSSGPERRDVSYDGNCLSKRYKNQHPSSLCHGEALAVGISPQKKQDGKKGCYNKLAVLASVAVVGAMALTGLLVFLSVKRKFARQKHRHMKNVPKTRTRLIVDKVISPAYTLQLLRDARYISETIKMGALGIPPYKTFVLDELKEATSNFSASNLIGEGSYGQVYKGLLTDGSVVAIRILKVKRKQGVQTYTHQLELFSKLRHRHLVSAIGHCFECYQDDSAVTRIFLVFEFVSNGTLRSFISEGQSGQKFTWTQRIAAAIGVAKGIQFLHTGIVPGVYSNCLKIKDILLDHDLHVKTSKYNLPLLTESRRLDEMEVLSHGSMLGCEEKNDVYDFGVILLEMIVGRTITSFNDVNISKDILSVSLTADSIGRRSIVDPAVHKECSDESLKMLIELCIRCLSKDASPSVEDVIWNLQFAAQVQDTSNQNSPLHAL